MVGRRSPALAVLQDETGHPPARFAAPAGPPQGELARRRLTACVIRCANALDYPSGLGL